MAHEPPAADAPSVLVVDDHRMVLLSTRLILSTAGFRVVLCERGDQVLACVLRERPDVVLLDIMMPGVDGWETLSQLKADPRTAEIPVVVFTAREHLRGQRLARELGAAGYVQKPYDADRLCALLREHAKAHRTSRGAAPATAVAAAIAAAAPAPAAQRSPEPR